jgi:hypothetical protein
MPNTTPPRAARRAAAAALGAAALAAAGCSLDLQNPNAPTEPQVTTSPDGVIALATGLQGRFAASYGAFAYMAGLVTDETAAVSAALISISDAEQGAVPSGTGVSDLVFNSIYRTVRTADDVLAGAEALSGQFEPGTRSGLRALALTLKAESLGEALQSYQRIPVSHVQRGRARLRAAGRGAAGGARAARLGGRRDRRDAAERVLHREHPHAGVSLPNVIQLYRARYARMANDHPGALAAANLVARSGPGALSVLTFPAPTVNPYANVSGSTTAILPRRSWRLSMQPQDQRWTYFVTPSATLTGRVGAPLDNFSRYANPQAPLPVYFPDEALLIKAEALANLGQLAAAQAALDSVRTDCTGGRGIDDPKACLPALTAPLSQGELLAEVYTQRRYELFGTGLRWEDVRRRNAIRGPRPRRRAVRGQRCWLPYAIGDRNANPNATRDALPDPAEPTGFPAGCLTQ